MAIHRMQTQETAAMNT